MQRSGRTCGSPNAAKHTDVRELPYLRGAFDWELSFFGRAGSFKG